MYILTATMQKRVCLLPLLLDGLSIVYTTIILCTPNTATDWASSLARACDVFLALAAWKTRAATGRAGSKVRRFRFVSVVTNQVSGTGLTARVLRCVEETFGRHTGKNVNYSSSGRLPSGF